MYSYIAMSPSCMPMTNLRYERTKEIGSQNVGEKVKKEKRDTRSDN